MKYKQYKSKVISNGVEVDSRLIVIPLPPRTVSDPFLASHYANSRGVTTLDNMEAKYVHAVRTQLRIGRLPKIETDVDIFSNIVLPTKKLLTEKEYNSVMRCLEAEVVDTSLVMFSCQNNLVIPNKSAIVINIVEHGAIDLGGVALSVDQVNEIID